MKTGLLSATVGIFIIEFYKTLSPSPGNQTVALLGQISQQLANSPNSTFPNTANQPFSPSASMIWVNAVWLISLVFSLSSALITTLLQHWARRYIDTPKVVSEPSQRARVRSFLFLGIRLYKMPLAAVVAPTLLHLSVFLFFAGLIITFHTIHKKVAIAIDVSAGLFGLAYVVLSILPYLDIRSPYRTPLSDILWYLWHGYLSFSAWLSERSVKFQVSIGGAMSPMQSLLLRVSQFYKDAARKHWQYLMGGLKKRVIEAALSAQEHGDRKIVTSMFDELDKRKLRKFVASIPRNKVLDFIPPIESGKIILQESFFTFLQSFATNEGATGLDENLRKHTLLVCLDPIHHIAKAHNIPDLNAMRTKWANIDLMRPLWADRDTTIRVTSRSICALVARQVARETLGEPQLHWLEDVTGVAQDTIYSASLPMFDLMNLKSFVYGVFSDQEGDLPAEDATSFKETLAILLDVQPDVRFHTNELRNQLSAKVQEINWDGPQGAHVVGKLCDMFPFLAAADPPHPNAPD